MTGGGVPPKPTPQEWLDSLPVLTAQAPEDGLIIFTGVLYGVTNLVYNVSNGKVRAAWLSTRQYWRFDIDTGEFVTASLVVGPQTITRAMISAAGLTASDLATAYKAEELTRGDISRRAVAI